MKSAALYTLGCKLNFAETSTIGRQFIDNGFKIVPFNNTADVYVINTCCLSHRAERECKQIIRRAIKKSPNAFIIVIGCYSQIQPEEIASIDGVDLVLGTKEKFKIFEFVRNFGKKNYPQIFVSETPDINDFGVAYSGDVDNRTRAFLKVQDGCDFKCSFCTIPLARGSSRSQSIEDSIKQMVNLAEKGYKEVVLSGVNVGDYGKKDNTNLLSLLKSFENIPGIERIRISSIEPNLLDEELVNFILGSDKFCNHFHIPLQSGSDEILKLMKRRYSTKNYRDLITYIKTLDKNAGIGADVIVGFPGETEKHFYETYEFIKNLPISYLHVFTYSERPNTPAAEYKSSIEPKVRFLRNEKLRILGQKKKYDFYSQFIDSQVKVLYEGKIKDDYYSGFTNNYIKVRVKTDEDIANNIIYTFIEQVDNEFCDGVISKDQSMKENSVINNKSIVNS